MPVRNVLKEVYDKSGYADLIDTIDSALRDLCTPAKAIIKWVSGGSIGSGPDQTGLTQEEFDRELEELRGRGVISGSNGSLTLSNEGLKDYLATQGDPNKWESHVNEFELDTVLEQALARAPITTDQKEEVEIIAKEEVPLAAQHPKEEDFEKAFIDKFPNIHKHIIGVLQEGPCPLGLLLEILPTENLQKQVFASIRSELQLQGKDLQKINDLLYIVDKKHSDAMSKRDAGLAIQVARTLLFEGTCPFATVKALSTNPDNPSSTDFKSFQKNIMSKVRDILEKYMKDFKLEGQTYTLRDLSPKELELRKEQRQRRKDLKQRKTSSIKETSWFDSVLQTEFNRLSIRHRASLTFDSVKSPLSEG